MSDLAAWLLEQIDTDERAALEVERPGDNSSDLFHCWVTGGEGLAETGMVDISPTRVLAECEAKREMIRRLIDLMPTFSSRPFTDKLAAYHFGILGVMALPYADRPGYREEWRP